MSAPRYMTIVLDDCGNLATTYSMKNRDDAVRQMRDDLTDSDVVLAAVLDIEQGEIIEQSKVQP